MKNLLTVLAVAMFSVAAMASGPDVSWTQGSSADSDVGAVTGGVSGSIGNGIAGNESGAFGVNESYGGSFVDDGETGSVSGTYSEVGGYSQGGSAGHAAQGALYGSGAFGNGSGFVIQSGGWND